jgi:hypothetical protein
MRSQMMTDMNSIKSYQAGTNEMLQKIKQQMEARQSVPTPAPLPPPQQQSSPGLGPLD